MKIGIDARMYGSGFTGIGRYTYELIRHLSTLDHENEYVVFLRKEAYEAFKEPNSRFKKVLADFPHYSFGEQIGFLRILNQEKLDLMHFTHFNAPIFYSRPFVVTIHDLTLSFFPGKKMTSFFYRLAYQLVVWRVTDKAKKIIAVSENTKKDLQEVLGLSADKITVALNGVGQGESGINPTPRSDLMKKFGIQKPYFLYTGVWRSHKNIVGMIKAFAELQKETEDQYNLVITGKPNPTYHEVPDTIKTLNLENTVHLVGLVSEEDLEGLYENALAYVFPSFYEGFGLPPLEAMKHGVPVVVSNTSAIPEVCGEGNALYFDPYKVDEIKNQMKKIATDVSLRQTLIDRGKSRVKDFSWKKMASEILNIYRKA